MQNLKKQNSKFADLVKGNDEDFIQNKIVRV